MGLNVLSPFNGISCGRVALERANIEVDKYVSYEIDEDANEVAKYNYPNDEYNGDVFEADFTQYKGFDLLIGGSPCTYWSIAKAGGERETTSSGFGFELFMQYVRALKESKCKWFLYENNSSISKEIQKEISKQLGVEPIEINSADFSAQERKRLYWTNIPVELNYIDNNLVFKDIEFQHNYRVVDFSKYKDTMRVNQEGNVWSWDTSGKGYYSQQSRARSKDIKMNTVPASGGDKNNIYLGNYTYRKLHPIEAERLQTLPDNYTSCIKSSVKRIGLCGNGWTVNVIVHILKGLSKNIKQ